MYEIYKRLFDLLIACFSVVILFPVFLFVAILVKATSKGPVFYLGERAAKGDAVFYLIKFRTMRVDRSVKGGHSTAIDDPRFTPVARFLRKYKLDELPQLFNVIVGQMSLVGPRPQVLYYTNKYTKEEKKILSVRPGITDLASLYFIDLDATLGSGDVDTKYATEIEPVKNKLRLRYVETRSFALDFKILLETGLRFFGIKGLINLDYNP